MTAEPNHGVARRAWSLRAAWSYFGLYSLWAGAVLAGLVPRGIVNDLVFLPLYFGAGLAAWHAAREHAAFRRLARVWWPRPGSSPAWRPS
ncbi:MAG: hypothetical protein SGJ01_01455 [Gemmatimonadota bacterium]|nr:hypothetical protein [Gemmatimonadota bacterium]